MRMPSLPKPSLPKRTPKSDAAADAKPKAAKTQVRVPRAVEDLYRDMRDRRLLLPALALVVAIVAVPILLTTPKEPAPAPAAFQPPEGSEAVAPAVLAEEEVGVRDYRKRLDELKSKNPFADSFNPPSESGDSSSGGELVDPASTSPTSPVPTSSTSSSDAVDTSQSSGDASATADSSSDDGSGDEILILAPRVDVHAGKFGKPRDIEGVETGDLLPSRKTAPVVMLVGVSDDLKFATFLVSDDVTETNGDGSCRPGRNDCEFLRLAEGEKRTFVYGSQERKYVVKVTDIREVIVDRRKVDGA
jgi:hypothetical protein